MLEGFLKGLKQPEYIHVLINPLPVYGLAMGLIGLILGLMLRSREARSGGFALILGGMILVGAGDRRQRSGGLKAP